MPKTTCDHPTFAAVVSVGRLTDDQAGRVVAYEAEVKVRCDACGESFTFQGLPAGSSGEHPTVSVDGQELRAPMLPASAKRSPLDKLGGVAEGAVQ